MDNNNLIQTKNILNMNNNNFSNSIRNTNFGRYNDLFSETNYSNYRRNRDYLYNSLYNNNNINNISTSLSSLEKINYNNPYRLSQSRSRSRSPCFCGCHSHEECLHHLYELSTPIVYPREQILQKYNNSLADMNEEINKKNDDLMNEIVYLKKNLEKIETELTRTKNEKDACNFYIKELEKELSKSNMSNELNNSKKRAINYAKMRDYEKYHDMLNKSFEVLDSVSNQCPDSKGKTKGGVNYYFNRDKDYDTVIKTQKNWINNLPISVSQNKDNKINNNYDNDNDNEDQYENDNDNEQYEPYKYQSDSNIYKYPEGYINMSTGMRDERNRPYEINNNSQNNIQPKRYYNSNQDLNYKNKSLPKKTFSNNNTYTYNNKSTKSNSNPKKLNKPYQSEFFPKHIMYKTNKGKNTSKSPYYRNNSASNIPKSGNYTYPYYSNSNLDNLNSNNELNNIPSKERYLVMDKFGNPIFISGKRLLAMELVPYLDKEGKEQLDNNGNILFIGPDGNPRTQDDLQPIILDNGKPLVNEENKPFLGIDNVIMVNRFGNPILGPGELYDNKNKVVKGELGILPKTNKGNLIKLNVNQEPLVKDNENQEDNINNNNEPNNDNNNINYKTTKPSLNKGDKNTSTFNNNKNNLIPLGLRPLIGNDGKPIRDKNNNPIILDKDGNPVQDPDIKLLLDKSGFPILNTLGQPIILDKNKNPLEISTDKDKIPDNNIIRNYNYKYSETKEKKPKTKHKKNNKKIKMDNLNRKDNKEKRRFNHNSTEYPKPNPSFQRKLNVFPERSNRFNAKEYLSSCFACDLGCSVSRSGYSPMTYSPYHNKEKRRDITPYK